MLFLFFRDILLQHTPAPIPTWTTMSRCAFRPIGQEWVHRMAYAQICCNTCGLPGCKPYSASFSSFGDRNTRVSRTKYTCLAVVIHVYCVRKTLS